MLRRCARGTRTVQRGMGSFVGEVLRRNNVKAIRWSWWLETRVAQPRDLDSIDQERSNSCRRRLFLYSPLCREIEPLETVFNEDIVD